MKLVYFFLCVNTVIHASGEKVHQGQLSFPQSYPKTDSAVMSDRYLPSEFQNLNPYFVSNNYDDPYKLLPSIQARLSNAFPTAFPILLTPTTDYKEERFQRRTESNETFNKSAPTSFLYNQTKSKEADRRTFPIKTQELNYKQPIDRIDNKASAQITSPAEGTKSLTANTASKKFIISTENANNQDLEQKASFHNIHFAPPPNVYIQSTTETAIPILRLSNEMDLDGSFSYEALGADQTHYVQHSRMENLGTDKESQVVEGSYSYVGDNGQTYTVHYIADSNGYRATGDHLPVPPPIPEIIQRSIQYNLAEEVKKPPHLRYYHEDENDSIYESDKTSQNYIHLPNNLFTGRRPEAFSFGLSHRTSLPNDLATASNTKEPINQNIEFTEDTFKRNSNFGALDPQVTFLASQGANLPLNKPQRLPQLLNYEPSQTTTNTKESENTKALWRWQYGSSSNTENLNPTKNLISRSSSEGDDVVINFNDMTPMEYSKAIRNYEDQYANSNYDLIKEEPKADHSFQNTDNDQYIKANNSFENNYYNSMNNHHNIDTVKNSGTEPTFNQLIGEYAKLDNLSNPYTQTRESQETFNINTPYNFAISTATPEWLDYESASYKPRVNLYPEYNTNKYSTHEYMSNDSDASHSQAYTNKVNFNEERILSSTTNPSNYNMIHDYESKEVISSQNKEQDVSTTETNIKDMLRNNMFLRNLFKTTNTKHLQNQIQSESNINSIIHTTPKSIDYEQKYVIITSPKPIRNEPTPSNDIKFIEKKPLDISEVLYYVINKNVFESNKLKTKRKQQQVNNDNKKYEPNDLNNDSKSKESKLETPINQNDIRLQPQQQEIRGMLKNYKVIQRNNVRKSNTDQENHSQNVHHSIYTIKLPHLGRAGPSTKSYLPPVYV